MFRMVPKPAFTDFINSQSFRAVLFRMVPKQEKEVKIEEYGFRAVLFRMVPKLTGGKRTPQGLF